MNMYRIMHRARGFTIIEMMVVIGIIVMLSSIVIVSLNRARMRARDARRVADVQAISLALDLYYNDNGSFPLRIYGAGGLAPTYMPVVPTLPEGGATCTDGAQTSCYTYRPLGEASATCNASNIPIRYHLGGVLEDETNKFLSNDADPAWNAYGCTSVGADFNGLAATCTNVYGNGAVPGGTIDKCFDTTQ